MNDAEIAAALAALRDRFVRNAGGRLDELDRALDLLAHDGSDAAALQHLAQVAHNLAGLGGTHGFPEVSEIARHLERGARETAGDEATIARALPDWREAVERLRVALAPEHATAAPRAEAEPAVVPSTIILCAIDDRRIAEHLADGLPPSMRVVHAASFASAEAELRAAIPDVLIAAAELPGGSGRELVELLRSLRAADEALALVVGAAAGGAMSNVELLRSGADSLLAERSPEAIAKRLHLLLERKSAEAHRILSVEDDPEQAEYLSAILGSAGYLVRICNDPAAFAADLQSFRPDLVLMDLDLPGARGDELAQAVRQSDELATLPIVFLTASADATARLRSARAGGDDFLTKPVAPPLLLATIAARVERSRHLAALFERDGVTGLLTHAVFFDRLGALWRERRRPHRGSAAVVLIDLDHFKRINDTYGHLAGDRVLASFGALARRRLRTFDLVGRYGGEEFALVVTELSTADTVALAERLREEFAATEQRTADGRTFHATFSAGIAPWSEHFSTPAEWVAAADAALYRAKDAGRNRVVVDGDVHA